MWIVSVVIVLIFFYLSAFFSGIETGLISVDRLKMEQAAKNDKKKKQILEFLSNPDHLFGTTLFGNNISVVIVTSVSIYLIDVMKQKQIFNISEHVATLIIAGLILVIAEIIPKALYRDRPNQLVTKGFSALKIFSVIFSPFVKFVSLFNTILAKLFKLPENEGYHLFTREDLSYMLSEAKDDGALHEDQREMLEEALEFTELDAENVMVHRTEIVAFEKNTPIPEVIKIAHENGYTRFPVYEEDLDTIIGILIIYDLIKTDIKDSAVAGDFVREAYFAPETTDVDHLLTEMQTNKKSMAIIVDSFGGTAGLVTIEDILEEIVGEIEDEYDNSESGVEKIDDSTYQMPGFMEIDFLNNEYEFGLPEGDYETIAGLIIDTQEKIPRQGTKFKVGFWEINALQVTDKKIVRVQLKNTRNPNAKNKN
ncbi:MAG: hemolysin family protein [Candidatus Cloacimonetes bacterium]|nr:hemolysin family protein [Candidatus Cloacimonadota bacterium]MCF7813868.1 hemolysin family protein [Candidatus Cloacimonadota bacterium]MCF7869452.1 hemolysin family protein [Candidatus Cloacimonadota bacterium]MCF7883980.1 hemolysin family protein [Candidatus Cloacimonadota bacterium]